MESRLEKNKKIKDSIIETRERRKTQVCKVFKIKIQDSSLKPAQREQLKMMFIEAKWLVNDILNWSELPENKPWEYKLGKTIKVKKGEKFETRTFGFLSVAERQAVHAEIISNIRTLSALKKQGKKVGRLKFRSEVKSINLKQSGVTHKILSQKRMRIQGISGKLVVNGLKQLPEKYELANAKLLNTPKGYYIALTIFVDKENKTKIFKPEIGIDMGCETSITISDGRKINASIEETVRLRKLQRKSARQLLMNGNKTTNNREKTKLLIRKEYQKLSNQKDDLANKVISQLLEHEKVYMQDENLKGWHKGGHGKKVQHSILGRVKAKLILNPRVVVLDRFVPTTQGCECGTFTKHTQDKRIFVCSGCGHTEDRDIHAAKNMIRFGKNENIKKRVRQGLSEFTPMDIEPLVKEALLSELSSVEEVGRSSLLSED